ncbi:hypothetical protein GQ42DRAFT_180628 [Ramicandelaber brevisporus]|nr:hypothetical protein GQ42DRAFT_180628 [Ramicandelaber brevisporus]
MLCRRVASLCISLIFITHTTAVTTITAITTITIAVTIAVIATYFFIQHSSRPISAILKNAMSVKSSPSPIVSTSTLSSTPTSTAAAVTDHAVYSLFGLPEELIEMVLEYLTNYEILDFEKAFGRSELIMRQVMKTEVISHECNPVTQGFRFTKEFTKLVRTLKIRSNSGCGKFDIGAAYPNCRIAWIWLDDSSDIIFKDHLAKMIALQHVKLVATNASLNQMKMAIDWINDKAKSGHVSTIEWVLEARSTAQFDTLQDTLSMIHHKSRVSFHVDAPHPVVNEDIFPQIIPHLSKLIIRQTSDIPCVNSKLSALFGSNEVFPKLNTLALPLCCQQPFNYSSITPDRFPQLRELVMVTMDLECTYASIHRRPTDFIFSKQWPSVTSFELIHHGTFSLWLPLIFKYLPNLIDLKVTAYPVKVNDILGYLPYLRTFSVTTPSPVYFSEKDNKSVSQNEISKSSSFSRFLSKVSFHELRDISNALQFVAETPTIRTFELNDCKWNAGDLDKFKLDGKSSVWTINLNTSNQKFVNSTAVVALASAFSGSLKTLGLNDYPTKTINAAKATFPHLDVNDGKLADRHDPAKCSCRGTGLSTGMVILIQVVALTIQIMLIYAVIYGLSWFVMFIISFF